MNANEPAGLDSADQQNEGEVEDAAPAVAAAIAGPSSTTVPAAPPGNSALLALCAIARFHQIAAEPATLAHQLGLLPSDPVSTDDLLRAAKSLGLKAKLSRSTPDRLQLTPLPALALMRGPQIDPGGPANPAGDTSRVVILAKVDGTRVMLQDMAATPPRPTIEPLEVFASQWTGELILITSRAALAGDLAKFDFSWFVPSLVKYRKLLGEVLLISFCLQLFALVSPLFFQVVMDKVLTHRGVTTLDVLVIGLVVVVVFESILNGLRSYVFSHTTSRIDVELGSKLFRHAMHLPMAYFQARRVGDTVARVRELENIRSFLTGNALTVVLDVFFSIVFIAVMLFYSVPLTLIVLVSLPLYFTLSLAVVPILRKRLDVKFARGAENQSMLVETVTGIQTVKASALEPSFGKRWDTQLAAYVSASFKAQNLATMAHEGVNLIGKLVGAATLWYGAHLVMANELTVGQFVAFNMFAQRVAQPIMRMAQLWTDFQQTGISVARLGDILNTRTEVLPSSAAQLPPIKGNITLEGINFRYNPTSALVLKNVSLQLKPGEVIGIVGQSGSGKSTLTKLIQRLYTPEGGRVLIDGMDVSLVDASQLRRQVGVVMQDNQLFNRSVRGNIAVADPAAPIEAVIRAAQLSGAHDFISQMPEGYDTMVGELGSSVSGGQRQRIAIARALFTNPRILILDEATSALDYESEAVLHRNMRHICKGRTVLIIAHKYSAVRHANRIIVIDKGEIAEAGSHDELMKIDKGLYAKGWREQMAVMTGDGPSAGPAQGVPT